MAQRAFRHRRHGGVDGILYHGEAAASLDRGQPGGAIIERAGEHDADRAVAIGYRRRPEQRIDRRTRAILPCALAEREVTRTHQKMTIGWCDIDAPRADRLAVTGIVRGEAPGL